MNRKIVFQLILITGMLLFFIACAEISLRILGTHTTYSEKLNSGYSSYFNQIKESHLWLHPANDTFITKREEFQYEYQINSFGFREKEIPQLKADSSFRIFTYGDSFCEGMGAPYDSTWPHLLKRKLQQIDPSIEIYNAGVSGSDPAYAYSHIKERHQLYEMDLAILTVNFSDYADFIYRGGLERFNDDGKTYFKKGPWWENIYEHSRLFRVMIHDVLNYSYEFFDRSKKEEVSNQVFSQIYECIEVSNELCEQQGIELLVLIHPVGFEAAYYNGKTPEYSETNNLLKLDSALSKSKIKHISLFERMSSEINEENLNEVQWPIDGHYNSKGYELMAHAFLEEIKEKLPELKDSLFLQGNYPVETNQ